MPFLVQVIDHTGQPDTIESLTDLIVDTIVSKGVGLFKTEYQVERNIRASLKELLQVKSIVVKPVDAPIYKACSSCQNIVPIWHTYVDGRVHCTDCLTKDKVAAREQASI